MSDRVKVRGADRLARTMKRAGKDLETMDPAVAEYGELVARTARSTAPSRTGALRSSIVVSGQQVLATVRYSVPVEFGSRRRGTRPARFMRQALSTTEQDRDRIFTKSADKSVDQIKGV